MKWLDLLMGRSTSAMRREHDEDKQTLQELQTAFDKVQKRTIRLRTELLRINAEMSRQAELRKQVQR